MEKNYFNHTQVSACMVRWCIIQLGVLCMFSQLSVRFRDRLTVSYVFFGFSLPLASDATFIFEETKHSVEAREMMQAFFVGIFVEVSDVLSCCVT